jgi:hypothetical protein
MFYDLAKGFAPAEKVNKKATERDKNNRVFPNSISLLKEFQ